MSLAGNSEADDPDPALSDYYERKVAGACTRTGCPEPAHDDLGLCLPHLQDARDRKSKLRDARRNAGKCVDCGRQAPKRRKPKRGERRFKARCRKCARGNKRELRGNNQHAPRSSGIVTKLEVDAAHPEGRLRQRYIGQGRRGRATKAEESRRDIGEAIKTLERARELAEALDDPRLSKLEKRSREDEVVALVKLAERFSDEVVDRHEAPATRGGNATHSR